jgi:multicomponent Na+:H+ antiporter subunit C
VEYLLALIIGTLYGCGLYMMMRRSIVKWILGLAMISHAANLLIFAVGRLTRESAPLIRVDETTLAGTYADPLPQALILTAIVIGFGVQAYAVVLIKRIYQTIGTDDLDKMTATDR